MLVTVIVVRIAWHMSFNARRQVARSPLRVPPSAADAAADVRERPDHFLGGMRGIVTLAAALALPAAFPFRDLIVLTAFCGRARHARDPGTHAQAAVTRAQPARRRSGGRARSASRVRRRCRVVLAALDGDVLPQPEAVRQRTHHSSGSESGDGDKAQAKTAHSDVHSRWVLAAA